MASEAEAPVVEMNEPQVDLNAASKEDLRTLSGLGPALAQRVIDYRAAHAGFQTPEEITKVSGIGQSLYDRWAHRLTVNRRADNGADEEDEHERSTATEAKSIAMDEMEGEVKMNEKKDVSVVGTDVVLAEEQVEEEEEMEEIEEMEAAEEAEEGEEGERMEEIKTAEPVSDVSESAYKEEMIAEAKAEAEEAEEAQEPEIAPAPTDEPTPFEPAALPEEEGEEVKKEEEEAEPEPAAEAPSQRGIFWGWVLASLLGGILGMIFSLLVFAGINGTLDVNNSAAILDLQDRVDGLSAELAKQETAIEGVEGRVSALEDITPRVEEVETAVKSLKEETKNLSDRADTLSSEVQTVADDVAVLAEDVTTSMTFFTRLQDLLNEIFGDVSGESE